jgi:hypothetical protein
MPGFVFVGMIVLFLGAVAWCIAEFALGRPGRAPSRTVRRA